MSIGFNRIYQGNSIDVLKTFPDEIVDCVVTSPPYWGLRDYGTAEWEGGDTECSHKRESKKSDKTITGHKNFEEMNGVGDAIYKSVCSRCGAKRVDKQLGLEETPEEFAQNLVKLFREIKRVLKKSGTVWLNLGDSYSRTPNSQVSQKGLCASKNDDKKYEYSHKKDYGDTIKPKDLVGIPWKVAFALQSDGWYLRQDIIWHKPNPMPESVKDRCTKAHEYIFLLSKSPKYFYDIDAIREPVSEISLKRAEYGWDGVEVEGRNSPQKCDDMKRFAPESGRNKRSVWKITTKSYKEAHFATFPPELPELCIKAGCPKDGVVLDPFFGSGTTGWVAQRLGRKWIGVELNPEYIKIADKRFKQQDLFA